MSLSRLSLWSLLNESNMSQRERSRAALESLLCSDPSLGGLTLAAHTDAELASAEVQATLCRTLEPSALAAAHRFPLAQQFVTRMMPAGHIKSSRSDDAPFLATMEASEKWLRVE